MTKAITGFLGVGAIAAFRPVARRMARKMREHCGQMAGQFKQMATRVGGRREAFART